MAEFFIKHPDGRIEGPITGPQLRAGVRVGKITPSTLVRQDGRTSWHAAGSIPGLAALFAEVAASQPAATAAASDPPGEKGLLAMKWGSRCGGRHLRRLARRC